MARTILMESVGDCVNTAVIEDGALWEFRSDPAETGSLAGNVYLGRVQTVVKSLNAAFVDIGAEKNGFLPDAGALKPGAVLPVQVHKEAGGQKGCTLTAALSLPMRLLVYRPDGAGVGVSHRIEDANERSRLAALGARLLKDAPGGVILRTEAQGAEPDELECDLTAARALWNDLSRRFDTACAPALLWRANVPSRVCLMDLAGRDADRILVEGDELYRDLADEARAIRPDALSLIGRYDGETPLFDLYGVYTKLGRAMNRKIFLPSGAFVMFDETEALTAIDVNTAKYTPGRDPREAILRTNLEAAEAVARLIRLRNVAGMIVVDFIDMAAQEDKNAVLERLRRACASDRQRVEVLGYTRMGLVEIKRKRVCAPLSKFVSGACPTCSGSGLVQSAAFQAMEIRRALSRLLRSGGGGRFRVTCAPETAECLLKSPLPAHTQVLRVPGPGGLRWRIDPAEG